MQDTINTLIERIPDPQDVRERMAEWSREGAVLRALLKAAEQRSKSKLHAQGAKRD